MKHVGHGGDDHGGYKVIGYSGGIDDGEVVSSHGGGGGHSGWEGGFGGGYGGGHGGGIEIGHAG